MKIAVPLAEGKLTMHFGHCASFAVVEIDESGKQINTEEIVPPPHEPGVLPKWLGEEVKANVIIAGGMGQRAQDLFSQYGVKVIVGAQVKTPAELVADYVSGSLQAGANACDH